MRQVLLLSAVAFGVFGVGASAFAQDMTFDVEEAQGAETEAGAEAGAETTGEAEAGGDVIGDLAAQETVTGDVQSEKKRSKEASEEIYAVQQIYALRINRLEASPSVGFSLNDPYLSHTSLGLSLNYWWTNVLAIGLNFNWYQGLEGESELGFHTRRSTRLAIPINQYQLGANLNFTYVPVYGKFGMFNEYIFQWDAYIVGGVGVMRTRPIPVIDPEVREFDFDWRIAFNLGVGIRVFITRWLAVFGELRDYAYLEKLENLRVALGSSDVENCEKGQRCDKGTWLADSPTLVNNVTAQLGLTIFFPFDFDYDLPR
jgi:outer membrane beta-barrel protein